MHQRKLIEQKEWSYYVYEKENTIELMVPIPTPAPGFDIVYTLSASEKEAYITTGIQALKSRIEDMNINYTTYELHSWR